MQKKTKSALITIGILITGYLIYRGIKAAKDPNAIVDKDGNVINKGTLPKAQNIALQQLAAMDRFGTDETALFGSLKGLTANELDEVFNAFGTVPYSNNLGQGSRFFSAPRNLFGWYDGELDKAERERMRKIWQFARVNKYNG